MAASIHHLQPKGSESGNRTPEQPTAPIVEELKRVTLEVLTSLQTKMFARADDALFEMGERAQSDGERRRYFDAMRVLRIEQGKINNNFADAIQRSFSRAADLPPEPSSGAIDFDELSIQPTEELEERIAITNLIARAEGLHKQLIWEVEQRLEYAARELGVPVSPRALAPERLCEAFGSALRNLDAEFQVKLIIYKLFEREVVRDLHRVYEAARELLDRHGIRGGARRNTPPLPEEALAPLGPSLDTGLSTPLTAPISTPLSGARSGAGGNDPRLMQMLRNYAGSHGSHGGQALRGDTTDAQLASELASALRHPPSSAAGGNAHDASLQRLTLANQYLDGMLSEPLLPESARPMFEKLRFPLIKTALADPSFFADRQHPLRQLLGELMDMAVSGNIGDSVPQNRLRDSVRLVAERADVDAGLVRNALHGMAPLDNGQLDHFFEQMREQEHSRRELILTKVRRLVAHELEIQTIGRDVPPTAQTLLLSGIGPLMAVRLLRHGRGSSPYREAQGLLERILDSLDPIRPDDQGALDAREALCNAIGEALLGIGMRRERIEELVKGLSEAYTLLDRNAAELDARQKEKAAQAAAASAAAASTRDPALPTVTVMELLSRILAPESWFRVYDPDRNITRWLKLASFYVNQDSVTFSGFDEGIKLSLRAHRFAEDLADGRSEPINPDARAREALDQLRRAKAAGLF